MKKITLLFVCLSFVGWLWAQNLQITGVVTDAADGQPIPGAVVMVKGTRTSVIADAAGRYTISAPADATLEISSMNMVTQSVPVGGRAVINVTLDPAAVQLEEIVVTAMGISREKKSLGFAVQNVGSEELTQAGQMSVTSSLTGKIAGVQVNQFGGTVGASSRISIRGNASLNSNQQPLIVVDGIPIANDTQRSGDNYYVGVDYGSGLNDINPEDIESITVLKGGSAALYGMRAGNGVILITTKSGRKAKGVSIVYDGNFTIDKIANVPKLQNSYGQGAEGSEYYWKTIAPELSYQDYAANYGFSYVNGKGDGVNDGVDESWGPRLDVGLKLPQFDSPVVNGVRQATDWVSRPNNVTDFFQTGYSMNHTIAVLSQTDKTNTRASLSYREQKGTVPNTDQRRYTGQLSSEMALNKYIRFDMSGNYTRTESDNLLGQGYGGNNPINSIILWSGRQINMQSLKDNWAEKDANGAYTYYNWNSNYHVNPYFNVNENTNSYQRDRIFGKAALYYEPFDFLKFEGRVGIDYYNLQIFEHHYFDYSDYPNGGFSQTTAKNTEVNYDFIATFHKNFGDFDVSVLAGANYRDLQAESHNMSAGALTVLGIYTIGNRSGDAGTSMGYSHIRSNSVYGNLFVGWKNQLYVDASARNDWSSTIKDNIFYPSVSLSWIPTATFENLKGSVLSFLKIRGGIAEIGNATSAYRNRAYYSVNSYTFRGVSQMSYSYQYPNEHLKPESILTKEAGIDIRFFDERLRLDLAYYYKTTTNQILSVSTSNVVGFSSILLNAGEIENKGIEVQLAGDVFRNPKGLNWTSTLNFSRDRNKIVELYPPNVKTYDIGWTWGISSIAKEGEPWGVLVADGYNRVTQDDVSSGKASANDIGAIKVNEEGLIMSLASQDIGHIVPDYLAGWRNDFTFKNLSFGFFLDLRIGGDIWSQSMSHGYGAGTAAITAENGIREQAIIAGENVMTSERFVMQDGSGNWVRNKNQTDAQYWFQAGGVSEMYVFDGSFLKLREAYITYSFAPKFLQKTKYIDKMSVSLIGSNLALLWTHKSNTLRLDPETGGVSSDSRGVGFEQASTPTSRSIGLKLGVTF